MPTLSAVTLSADELAAVDAFWGQKVYYNGRARSRWELMPALAVTPGMTPDAALFHLISAEIVGPLPAIFADGDDDGWRTTKSGHHIHIGEDGKPDKGNPEVLHKMDPSIGKEIAGRLGHAALQGAKAVGKAAGAVGKAGVKAAGAVGKAGLKVAGKAAAKGLDIGKHVAKEAVTSAVEIGSNALRDGASATDALAETAMRKGSRAVKGGMKLAGKAAVGTVKGGFKLARAVAKRIGFAISARLVDVWGRLKSVQMSADVASAVLARFAA